MLVKAETQRSSDTIVREPLHFLFVQTEESANIAQLRTLEQRGIGSYPAWMQRMYGLKTTGMSPDRLTVINVADGDQLPEIRDLQKFDAISVGGSGHMTTENTPMVRKTRIFIAEAAATGIQTKVVCFGHQLAHEAHGGKTGDADELQFGVREIELTDDGLADPVNIGFARRHLVFESNSRRVTELAPSTPDRRVIELSRGRHPNHATRIGENLYTSQWHPDLDAEIMDALAVNKASSGRLQVASREDLEDIIKDIRRDARVAQANGELYAQNWKNHVVIPHRLARSRA